MNYQLNNKIATLAFDDGKVNAVNFDFIEAMESGLERAESEADAVIITGRDGLFSAGFDLKIIKADPERGLEMIKRGMDMLYRMYSFPKPMISACNGHAIGLGAFVLLASDTRIGSDADYQVTLPETSIAMPFNVLLMEMAKARIARQNHFSAIVQSKPHTPKEAAKIGFLDAVVAQEALMQTATQVAEQLCQLPADYYAKNKLDLRGDSLKVMAQIFDQEIVS